MMIVRLFLLIALSMPTSVLAGPGYRVVPGKSLGAGAPAPDAFYVLDAVCNTTQLEDSVDSTCKGGGADTVSFTNGWLDSDSITDLAYVPGSELQYSTSYTIYFEYKVSTTSDVSAYELYYSANGDAFTFLHYSASGIGKFSYRADYGTLAYLSWSNTGYAVDTWHTVYVLVNITGQTMTVYYNGSEVTGKTESGFTNIINAGTLAGDLYLAYDTSPTGTISIRNFKVFPGLVTP